VRFAGRRSHAAPQASQPQRWSMAAQTMALSSKRAALLAAVVLLCGAMPIFMMFRPSTPPPPCAPPEWIDGDVHSVARIELKPLICGMQVDTIEHSVVLTNRTEIQRIWLAMRGRFRPYQFLEGTQHWTMGRVLCLDVLFASGQELTFFVTIHSDMGVASYMVPQYPDRVHYSAGGGRRCASPALCTVLDNLMQRNEVAWVSSFDLNWNSERPLRYKKYNSGEESLKAVRELGAAVKGIFSRTNKSPNQPGGR